MRLLLDEMHSPRVAAALAQDGFDVVSIGADVERKGHDDVDVMEFAVAQRRVVVTENLDDFASMASAWLAQGGSFPGIVLTPQGRFVRTRGKAYPGSLIRALRVFLADPPVSGDSWIWWLSAAPD